MDKKKKPIISKKHSLNFPFKFDYKIITSDVIKEYLLNRFDIIYKFNIKSKKSVKFGINAALKYSKPIKKEMINDTNTNINNKTEIINNKCLIFAFYNSKLEILWDLLINQTENNKIYFIDETYKNLFLKLFNLKKTLCFTIIENKANEEVFREMQEKLKIFEMNKELSSELIFDKSQPIKEITSVFEKRDNKNNNNIK